MRKLIILISGLFIANLGLSQNPEMFGITGWGGEYGVGTIFKTDINSQNHQTIYSFPVQNEGQRTTENLFEASNGKFYGVTSRGGDFDKGVIFEYDPENNIYIKKYDFEDSNGRYPSSSFIEVVTGKLIGTTIEGGTYGLGVIYEYDFINDIYTKKINLQNSIGSSPISGMIIASDGSLYGTTYRGGMYNYGVIYQYDYTSNIVSVLHEFDGTNDGGNSFGELTEISQNSFYGTNSAGGLNNEGVLYEFNVSTKTLTVKVDFERTTSGFHSRVGLTLASNNKLYGVNYWGGINNDGTIFEYDYINDLFDVKHHFKNSSGANSRSKLYELLNGLLYGTTYNGGTNDDGVIFQYDINTEIYQAKIKLDNNTGSSLESSLIKHSNGLIYGVTYSGGTNGKGVVFEYNIESNTYLVKTNLNTIKEGAYPSNSSLVQYNNGMLYGTASLGGSNESGVLFELNPSNGEYSKKIDFGGGTGLGVHPTGDLVIASNGLIYGLTNKWNGTIFEYDPTINTIKTIHYFDNLTSGGLLYDNNKLFGFVFDYGENDGYIYEFNLEDYTFKHKAAFDGSNGSNPIGSLLKSYNGLIYGTAATGGTYGYGTFYSYDGDGTITPIHHFSSDLNTVPNDGAYPIGNLLEASNGKIYGVTRAGGYLYKGNIFEYDITSNAIKTKYIFEGYNGDEPWNGLIEGTDGDLFGMTQDGGTNNNGIIYEYNLNNSTFTKHHDFDENDNPNGSSPRGYLTKVNCYPIEDNSIYQIKDTLFANISNYEYQWINCDTGEALAGETNQKFNPTEDGNYSVLISNGKCETISECMNLIITPAVGFSENDLSPARVFPNPTSNSLFIIPTETPINFELSTISGQLLFSESDISNQYILDLSNYESGLYLISISNENKTYIKKIMKY